MAQQKCCIFRTPSVWTLSPGFQRTFWEPSMANSCSDRFAFPFCVTGWSSPVVDMVPTTAPHGGEGSDACAHGGDMSSRASQWPVRSRPPQLRQGGGWCKVRQPTGTEDGQGRGGCEQSSTETEVQSRRGCGALRVV